VNKNSKYQECESDIMKDRCIYPYKFKTY